MLSSPIKWVGGKYCLRRKVIAALASDAECYAEVFAGAAWVLFGKEKHPIEVLNDINGDLVNLWRVIKWRPAELLEAIHQYLYSREMFFELRDARPPEHDELGRAVWMYLMIQMSFGADLSRIKSERFGCFKSDGRRFFLSKSLLQIEPAAERLRDAIIERLDFADLIRRYDQPRTLFFCDPPYYEQQGYATAFTLEDHQRLAEALRSIKGRFLLIVNDHPVIRALYDGLHINEGMQRRAIARDSAGRKAAPILFVSNYDTGDRGRAEVRAGAQLRASKAGQRQRWVGSR
ncbi:MAG TPA: DNA adenine methylase [Blastocatellia bacterium]|nr:DNA adenine methylase [Blastocatellia bacterium]